MIEKLLIFVLLWSILCLKLNVASIQNDDDQQRYSEKSHANIVEKESSLTINNNNQSNLVANQFNGSAIHFVNLEDDHEHLTVHWAGKNSPVIICLARNRPDSKRNQSSAVYISHNYGETFEKVSKVFKLVDQSDKHAIIETFYISPVLNSYYLFMDRINQLIFITKDFGKNFQRIRLPFIPKKFQLHHTIPNLVLAQSIETEKDSMLYLSENFGLSWRKIQEQVGYFSWSIPRVDQELKNIFVQRLDPEGISSLISSSDFFADVENIKYWVTHCEKIEIRKRFIFAACRFNLFGFRTDIPTFQLWISVDREPFSRALFATDLEAINYHIADITDDAIFLAVTFNDTTTNLYTSNSLSYHLFTLSLENIVFYNPNISKNIPGINYEISKDQEFADLHPVAGIRGTYVISKWKNHSHKSISDIITLITYDFGNRWHTLKPPSNDAFGHPIQCNTINNDINENSTNSNNTNCSLHLVQRYLSMTTNSKPILSVESSVGYIMATGVLGSSLKGKQNIYLSIDAGNTWRQILSGNYLYAFGDFGSIIVAVEHYSKAGATNELLYSLDDGYSFSVYKFHYEKIRVYGLLTEPGEKNAVFTIFGSKENIHEWTIIQVNLTDKFEFQCQMPHDYKEWSPHDYESKCLLGSTQIYMRRMSSKKCFNGNEFIRPVSYLNCPCKHSDYECDFGYTYVHKSIGFRCEPVELDKIGLSQEVPKDCKPGSFFNKTQGYRKLPGDTCEGGEEEWYSPHLIPCPLQDENEFILFVQRQEISMIPLNDMNFTKHPLLPKSFLSNAIAADFDLKNKCLYWSDIHSNRILKYCFDGKQFQPEVFIQIGLDSVEGIAFNQINGHLYFVNGNNSKVEMVDTRVNHEGRKRRTILKEPDVKKPRGIAVDAIDCYLFITDWSVTAAIIRTDLDGENVKVLFNSNTVTWPNGIAVDLQTKRIFWVDAKRDYVASANYNGEDLKYLLQGDQAPHPFALGVFKNFVFYDDWILKKLILLSKNNASVRHAILEDVTIGMDLKIISNLYPNQTNICNQNTTCPDENLCIPKPFNSFRCVCPDGFFIEKLPDGNEKCLCGIDRELTKTGACKPLTPNATCLPNEFQCDKGNCISRYWKCDKDDDCGDGSDEKYCNDDQCKPGEFRCKKSGWCIQDIWICNHEKDCDDGSDEDLELCEKHFPICNQPDKFQCQNHRCIDKNNTCDFIDHCLDGSDEFNCLNVYFNNNETCEENHFKCDNGDCIQRWWRCDGYFDCLDKSDENDCQNECTESEFSCPHNVCIDKQWVCDNDKDCIDGSDELNCDFNDTQSVADINNNITDTNGLDLNTNHDHNSNNFCPTEWFHCKIKNFCIPSEWFCDGNSDCPDSSDELQCPEKKTKPETIITTNMTKHDDCGENKFSCYKSNQCIFHIFVCDGSYDCSEGEDEANCKYDLRPKCPNNYFSCLLTLGCIPTRKVCDGRKDCFDGSDEWGCLNSKVAVSSFCKGFKCKTGDGCIQPHQRCDYEFDCLDGSDELNCDDKPRNHGLKIFVQYDSIRADQFIVYWTVPDSGNRSYLFKPSYINETHHMNTSWTTEKTYKFEHLHPGSTYKIMVFSKFADDDTVYTSQSIKVTTESIKPRPPENFSHFIIDFNRVLLKWSAPKLSEEPIKGYRIYQTPPEPPLITESRENHIELCCLQAGINYTFWVTTLTKNLESDRSQMIPIYTNSAAIVKSLSQKNVTNNSVSLGWKSHPTNITKWLIIYTCEDYFPSFSQNISTNRNEAIIENLSPGVNYQFKLYPYIGDSFRIEGVEDNVISIRTLGSQLPSVVVHHEVSGSKIQLSWSPPPGYLNMTNIEWKYAIYMGDTIKNLKLYAQTKDTKIILKNLYSCQMYLIEVRVIKPFGLGPAHYNNQLKIMTEFDATSPPRDVQIRPANMDQTEYKISWNSSCPDLSSNQKIGYIVSVYDLIHKRLDRFRFKPTQDVYHSFTLSVHYGAKYEIKISTSAQDSRWTDTIVLEAPSMPIVGKPFAYIDDNERINIVWKTIDNYPNDYQQHKLQYKVYVHNEKDVMNGEFLQIKEPPAIFQPKVKSDLYYIGISLIDNHGYYGPLSETYQLYVDDLSSLSSSSPGSSNLFLLSMKEIFIILVTFNLTLLLIFFAVKKFFHHKPSLIPIISSHYNSRSESATLTSYDLHDEDNRAYSDDEPLVLA